MGANMLEAAINQQWDKIKDILTQSTSINVNACVQEGINRGKSVLWYTAYWEQWDLVKEMLRLNPQADINAAPQEGKHKGKSVLWYAAGWEQWDLVKEILRLNPQADINAASQEGETKGISVLWYTASWKQWDVINTMLAHSSFINPDILQACSVLNGEHLHDLLIALVQNPKFAEFDSLDLGNQINLTPASISVLKAIFDTHLNCTQIKLKSAKISQQEMQELEELMQRNYRRKTHYQEANTRLLNISACYDILEKQGPSFTPDEHIKALNGQQRADYLTEAWEIAEQAFELGHPYAKRLITQIKVLIFTLYCNDGQAEDALEFMNKHFLSDDITAEEKINLYTKLGQAFYILDNNEKDRYHYLVKSAVFLTEALSLLEKDSSQSVRVKDVQTLLLNVMNSALGRTGLSPSFDLLKVDIHFPKLAKDIIEIKNKILCKPAVINNSSSNLNDFCQFVYSQHITISQKSFYFWPISAPQNQTVNNESIQQSTGPQSVSNLLMVQHPIFSVVSPEQPNSNPNKRGISLANVEDDLQGPSSKKHLKE